jgi:hypothetical protein
MFWYNITSNGQRQASKRMLAPDLSGADAASQDLFPYIFDAMSAFPVFRSTGTETLIGVALR